MTVPSPTLSIQVDVTNPGQFFACCGLLELAHRLWPGVEGWFARDGTLFVISHYDSIKLTDLVSKLVGAEWTGSLSNELAQEREQLEKAKKAGIITKGKENRRAELGKLLREGPVLVGEPFKLLLDWWQEDSNAPKTWAGSQQVLRIGMAALGETARAFKTSMPFEFKTVMRPAADTHANGARKPRRNNTEQKAEPFYFDSRHGSNALPLDIGFSPNELGMESKAFPAVELLCLMGLQRCRPIATDTQKVYCYFPWEKPLPVTVLPAAVCGYLGQSVGFRFENAYRTDQRKHKGFLTATPFTR